ncbi:MAG: hypothetical protein ABIJ31_08265 [Pseudomonadota bacterium]
MLSSFNGKFYATLGWSLPPSMVRAVEYHHCQDENLNTFRTAAIDHVADYLYRRIGIGSSGDKALPELVPDRKPVFG